jgi:hypothetical protein
MQQSAISCRNAPDHARRDSRIALSQHCDDFPAPSDIGAPATPPIHDLPVYTKESNMNRTLALAFLTFGLFAGTDAAMAERVRAAGAKPNAAGGTTAGRAAAGSGRNGGAYARGAGVATDAQGNAVGGSAAAVQTANGGQAARAGAFQRNADGSATRQGGFAASGQNGAAQSSGGVTRSADGTFAGARSTQATNANTGNSYAGETTYSNEGASHSGTCTDADGNAIDCPQRK